MLDMNSVSSVMEIERIITNHPAQQQKLHTQMSFEINKSLREPYGLS